MKVKVSRKEIRECVESAVLRLISEGKSLHKFRDDDKESMGDRGKRGPKHGKLDKRGTKPVKGGNKGNFDWSQEEDEI